VLLTCAHDGPADIVPAWRAYLSDPEHGDAVRIIDLLDEDVDLSPVRRRAAATGADLVGELTAATEVLRSAGLHAPEFEVPEQRQPFPVSTVGELVRAGVLTVRHAPARMATDSGDVPVLTADDLAEGRPPSGRTAADTGLVDVEAGDVVASVLGAARVLGEGGAVLGPYLARYRVDPERLDPDFLAGLLRAAEPATHGGSSRIDARRVPIPRLPLADQRRYGAAFRQLADVADTVRAAAVAGETLVRLGLAGLVTGHLVPGE
jgi:hypothetical protein